MAEPLAIAMATIGAWGFAIAVRRIILDDVDAFRRDADNLVPTVNRLTSIIKRIRLWQKLWKVYDGMPRALYDDFWGAEGTQNLLLLVSQIQTDMGRFHDFLKDQSNNIKQAGKASNTGKRDVSSHNEEIDVKMLHDVQKTYRQESGLPKRIWWGLYENNIFKKRLEELEQNLSLLEENSVLFFRDHNRINNDKQLEDNVEVISMNALLPSIVDHYSGPSTALRQVFKDAGDCDVDLLLERENEPGKRMEFFEKAIRNKRLGYGFSAMCKKASAVVPVDFLCLHKLETPDQQKRDGQEHRSLTSVLDAMIDGKDAHASSCFKLKIHETSPEFSVSRLSTTPANPEGTQSESLRHFMASHKPDYDIDPFEWFSKTERHRLAYELAEWALIFLKTTWFTDLCSCCIYRIETEDLETTFRKGVTGVVHKCSETGKIVDGQQWCQKELSNMHIQRLGILLVEIALASPVLDARYNPLTSRMEINGGLFNTTPVLYLRDINREVQRLMGWDFKLAISHCLKQASGPEDIKEVDQQAFLSEVVEPLYRHYATLSTRGPEQRRARRRERASKSQVAPKPMSNLSN